MSSLLFSLIANRAREILSDCQLAKKNECTTSQGGEKARKRETGPKVTNLRSDPILAVLIHSL